MRYRQNTKGAILYGPPVSSNIASRKGEDEGSIPLGGVSYAQFCCHIITLLFR